MINRVYHACLVNENHRALELIEPYVHGIGSADPNAHLWYGRVLARLNRNAEARVEFKKVIDMDTGRIATEAKAAMSEIREAQSITSSITKGGRRGYIGLMLHENEVQSVVPNSPAAAAYILAGDKIIEVDHRSTSKMHTSEIVKYIHGPIGTTVSILIERKGKQYLCTLKRSEAEESFGIHGQTVDFKPASQIPISAQPTSTSQSKASETNASTSKITGQSQSSASSNQSSEIDRQLITVFRPSSDSQAVKEQALSALQPVRLPLKKELLEWGLRVTIVPNILEARPELRNTKPRGYIHGGDYNNCAGMFMPGDKTILVAERASIGSSPYQRNVWVASTMLHELGHAVDAMKSVTKSDPFQVASDEDNRRLTNELRNKFYYYTQTEGADSELFAQLFAIGQGAPESDAEEMTASFPRTMKFVRELK